MGISIEKATENGEKVYAKLRQIGRSHVEAKRDAESWVRGNYGLTVEIHPDRTPKWDTSRWADWGFGPGVADSVMREAHRYAEEVRQRREEREREAAERQRREAEEVRQRVQREREKAARQRAESAERAREAFNRMGRATQHAGDAADAFRRAAEEILKRRDGGGEQRGLWE